MNVEPVTNVPRRFVEQERYDAALRRIEKLEEQVYELEEYIEKKELFLGKFNKDNKRFVAARKAFGLTRNEAAVFFRLLDISPKVVGMANSKLNDVYVCKIRKKLSNAGFSETIKTLFNEGKFISEEKRDDLFSKYPELFDK